MALYNALLFVVELMGILLQFLWLWFKSVVFFFVPTRFIAKDIRGQTVLITGAGGGLGSLLARRFASLGCPLILWDINQSLNEKAAASLEGYGVPVTTYTVDVSSKEEINKAVEKVISEIGQVDILVNNAGLVFGKKILDSQPDQVVKTFEVNCLSHFWIVQAFLPAMLARKRGHIVTIASSAGLTAVPGMADYCSSKFAAVGFEESLRLELSSMDQCGVKTTIVCPFLIDTGMFDGCQARFPLILDALQPDYVSDKVVEAVLREQKFLLLPRLLFSILALKGIMPIECQELVYKFFGIPEMMSTFTGSRTKVKVN